MKKDYLREAQYIISYAREDLKLNNAQIKNLFECILLNQVPATYIKWKKCNNTEFRKYYIPFFDFNIKIVIIHTAGIRLQPISFFQDTYISSNIEEFNKTFKTIKEAKLEAEKWVKNNWHLICNRKLDPYNYELK